MTKEQLKQKLTIESEGLSVESIELSSEWLKDLITAKIYRSAVVIKNAREADKGGIKLTIGQALKKELITPAEGLTILLTNDKKEIERLRDLLPKGEKSDEPSEEDINGAIAKVLAGGGQQDF